MAAQASNINTNAPSIGSLACNPAQISVRGAGIGAFYQFYRLIKLQVVIHPAIYDTAVVTSVGYVPNTPNTAPTTHQTIMDLPGAKYHGAGKSVDTVMKVPKTTLLGDKPIKWYQANLGTEDSEWEVQGTIYFGFNTTTAAAGTYAYTVEGVFEFKGRSNDTLTPEFCLLLAEARAKMKALEGSADETEDSVKKNKDRVVVKSWADEVESSAITPLGYSGSNMTRSSPNNTDILIIDGKSYRQVSS